jgi:Helix-turn-helix domain
MTYLTHWRLALAADLLHQRDVTLTAVARQLGYSDGFALSTAFKRVRGVSPEQYRSSRAIESGCRHGLGRGQDGGVGEHDEVAGRGCPDAWTGARGRDGPASGAWSVPVGPARCPGPRVLPHRYAAHPGGEPGPRLLRRHHRLELQRRPRRCRAAATSGSTTPPSAVANPLPLLRTVLRLRVQSDPLPNGGRSQDLMATLIG